MKKVFSVITVFLFGLLLVACNDSAQVVKNLSIDNHVLKWDKVDKAEKYIVVVGDIEEEVITNEFSLLELNLGVGEHVVGVKVVIGGKTSSLSKTVKYLVDISLKTPENLKITGTVISWDSVEDATGYIVVVGDKTYEVFVTNFDLATLELSIGSHNVKVQAVSEAKLSAFSNVVTYVIAYEVSDEEKNKILKLYSELYSVNMKEEDFNDQNQYEIYLLRVAYVDDYIEAATVNNLPVENIYSVFNGLTDFLIEEVDLTSFNDVVEYIEYLETLGLTGNLLGAILHNKGIMNLKVDQLEQSKTANPKIIEMLETEKETVISAIKSAYDFVVVMKNTLNSEQASVIMNKLFAGESLTIAEAILIKDVILPVIKNSVPSEKELEDVYKLLLTVVNETGLNGDYDELIEYAKVMAQANSVTIGIILDFVEEIDEVYLNEVKNILSNEENIVSVLIYTLEYYEDFIVGIKERYDGILTNEELEIIYVQFFNMIIDHSEKTGDLEGIEALIIFRDNYKLFSKLFEQYSDKAIPLMISLANVYSAINDIEGEFTSEAIGELIAGIANLDSIIFADFGEENLTTILEFITLFVNMDFNEMYKEETEALIEIVISLNEIKSKILTEANKLEARLYFEHPGLATGDYKEIQYKIIYFATTALDKTLTKEVKTEINRLIDIMFSNVLSNQEIVEMLGLAEYDLAELEKQLKDKVSDYTYLISELAGYDYNNLTEENWQSLEMLADDFFGNENFEYNFNDAVKVNAGAFEMIIVEDLYGPLVYEIVFDHTGSYEYQLILSESNLFVELYVLDQDGQIYLLEITDGVYSYLYLEIEYVYYLVIHEEYGGLINIQMQLGIA